MTLRQAGKETGCDPKYLKGYAAAMGIRLHRISDRLILIDRSDLERLRARLDSDAAPQSN